MKFYKYTPSVYVIQNFQKIFIPYLLKKQLAPNSTLIDIGAVDRFIEISTYIS
jgi:hypothetical protein